MAYTLPNSIDLGESTGKAFTRGTDLYKTLMASAMAKAQNKRAEELQPYQIKHIMSQINNANAANARNQGLYGLKKQALENSLNPEYAINNKINLIEKLKNHFSNNKQQNNENLDNEDSSFNELFHRPLNEIHEENNPLFQKLKSIGMFGNQEQGQGALLPEDSRPMPGEGSMTDEQLDEYIKNKSHHENKSQEFKQTKGFTEEEHALGKMIEKETGYNPYPKHIETPEEKDARALELFQKKEAIKAQNKKGKPGEIPLTTAMKTKLQGVVTGVDNSLPVIKELVTDFKNLPTGSETLNPAAYAAYNAKANAIIEPLINAFGLNVTDATKEMMHDQVFRRTNEPLSKYRNRLVDLAKEIIRRRNDSFTSLDTGRISPKSEFTNEFFENLKNVEETKMDNGKLYYKVNGEWHE